MGSQTRRRTPQKGSKAKGTIRKRLYPFLTPLEKGRSSYNPAIWLSSKREKKDEFKFNLGTQQQHLLGGSVRSSAICLEKEKKAAGLGGECQGGRLELEGAEKRRLYLHSYRIKRGGRRPDAVFRKGKNGGYRRVGRVVRTAVFWGRGGDQNDFFGPEMEFAWL